jgi:hypothetical protein
MTWVLLRSLAGSKIDWELTLGLLILGLEFFTLKYRADAWTGADTRL